MPTSAATAPRAYWHLFWARKTSIHYQQVTRPSSFVVQSLSSRCPVVVQSMTGQQLDNNWTTTGQRTKEVRLGNGAGARHRQAGRESVVGAAICCYCRIIGFHRAIAFGIHFTSLHRRSSLCLQRRCVPSPGNKCPSGTVSDARIGIYFMDNGFF